MKAAGYVPHTDSVPPDACIEEKLLHHHNERISFAFALISLPIGKPVIENNKRAYGDCHLAIKFITKGT